MRRRSVLAVVLLAALVGSAALPGSAAAVGTDAGVDSHVATPLAGQPPAAVAGSGPTGAAAPTTADRGSGPVARPPNFTKADPATVIRINVTAEGDARWTVASRFRLENETQVAAFEEMAADVRNGTGPVAGLGYSVEHFRTFAAEAEALTARDDPMAVEAPEWDGRVDAENDTGVLALSFTWTNFADRREDGRRIVLGDVFASGDEAGWFPALSADQRLVINAPPGYLVRENSLPYPILEGGSIRVDGPVNLSAQEVSIVYSPQDRTDDPPPSSSSPPTSTPPDQGIPGWVVGGGFGALVVGAILVGYLLYRRPDADGGGPAAGGTGDAGAGADTTAAGDGGAEADPADGAGAGESGAEAPGSGPRADEAAGGATAEGEAGAAGSAAAAGGATAEEATAEDDAEGDDDGVDPELLSDEERVERLLRENGGRMKQSNIVTETGWSNAKVSQLLSSMDEEDRIDKLRIGRENLIALPEEDVGEIE